MPRPEATSAGEVAPVAGEVAGEVAGSALPAAVAVPGRSLGRHGAVLAVATLGANVLGYVLVLVLSRALLPAELGAVGALLNLTVIGAVPALAIQLVAAREVARGERDVAGLERRLRRLAVAVGLGLGVLVTLLAPLLERFLHLSGAVPALLLACTLVPATVTFAAQGMLLGRERFPALSALYLVSAGLRFAGGALAAVLGWGVTGVLAATAVAAWLALVAAALLEPGVRPHRGMPGLRRRSALPPGRRKAGRGRRIVLDGGSPAGRALARDVGSSMVSTAGLLVLFNVDVLLARHFLPPDDSGLYAVGALFAKAAFWGPQFLATLLYPRMTSVARRGRAVAGGVALTGAVGLTAVAGATVLGDVAVSVAAGTSYLALAPDVWIFAALGASLAVVQVLVYARLAVSDRRLGLAAWAVTPAVCLVVATVAHGSVVEVAATALAGAVVLVVWGLVLERAAFGLGPRNARASEPAPGVPPVPGAPPVPGTRPRS